MSTRCPIQCIIPTYLLKKLLEKITDPEKRDKLINSLALSSRMRGRREVMASMPTGAAVGTKRRAIYDLRHDTSLPGHLVRREEDPPTGDVAVNEAFDGLGATYDLFYEEYRRNSIDDRGMLLIASVHYDADFNNAFWDGSQMVFGDGDGELFTGFTKSIDVIGHELTHGVVDRTCGLEYRFQSGALNESFADVFGSLVKQRALNQTADEADWLIGAEIFTPALNGDALRSMKEPGTAYDGDPQPGHMDDFKRLPLSNDNGGVHYNSGIPNHAFYFLAADLGGQAWKDAGQIWYLTMQRLHERSEFQEAANVSFAAAGELFGAGSRQQQAVRDAWEQVGLRIGRTVVRSVKKAGRRITAEDTATAFNGRFEELAATIKTLARKVEGVSRKLEEARR